MNRKLSPNCSRDSPFCPFSSFCPLVESVSYVESIPNMRSTSTRLRQILSFRPLLQLESI